MALGQLGCVGFFCLVFALTVLTTAVASYGRRGPTNGTMTTSGDYDNGQLGMSSAKDFDRPLLYHDVTLAARPPWLVD